jgi:PEP-CTERM motif-containing protein
MVAKFSCMRRAAHTSQTATRVALRLGDRLCRMAAAAALATAAPATCAALVFDFDSVELGTTVYPNGLDNVGSSNSIASYMNGVLATGGYASSTVTVSGALATKTYNGEGHVLGTSLGFSDGGAPHPSWNDTFIINNNFGIYASATDRFTLSFSNFKVYSVSFDWQIFADATCPAGSSCAALGAGGGNVNWPDIALLVDGNATPVWSHLASIPAPGTDPQGLGVTATFSLNGAQTLTFRDWPAEIGIDNLRIAGCDPSSPNCLTVPEPSTLPLAALGLLSILAYSWRHQRRLNRSVATR